MCLRGCADPAGLAAGADCFDWVPGDLAGGARGRGRNGGLAQPVELMRWMPQPRGVSCAMKVPWEPIGGHIDDDDDQLAGIMSRGVLQSRWSRADLAALDPACRALRVCPWSPRGRRMLAFRVGLIEGVCAVGAAYQGAISPSPRVPAGRNPSCWLPASFLVFPMPPRPPGRACRCATWRAASPRASGPAPPWPCAARFSRQSPWPSPSSVGHPGSCRRWRSRPRTGTSG